MNELKAATMENKNGYALQKNFLEWAETTEKPVRHIHYALMWVIIELNNRLKWIEIFGLPSDSIMSKTHINGRRHYYKALHELIEWGFIKLHEKSKNQHTCNRVSLILPDTLGNKQGGLPDTLGNKQGGLPGTLSNTQGSHNKTLQTSLKHKKTEILSFSLIDENAR